jgi:hypothetical protein
MVFMSLYMFKYKMYAVGCAQNFVVKFIMLFPFWFLYKTIVP